MFDEQPDGDPHGECAAEIHRLTEENARMRYALKIAAKTFGEYAEIHAAKTPPEGLKVRRNENLRDMCREALTPNVQAQGRCAALSRSVPWSAVLGAFSVSASVNLASTLRGASEKGRSTNKKSAADGINVRTNIGGSKTQKSQEP